MQPRSHRDWFERDPGFAAVPREIRCASGSTGASIVRVRHQPPGFYARAVAPEFTLTLLEKASGRGKVSYGGDAFEVSRSPGDCLMAPADADLAYEPEAAMDGLIVLFPQHIVRETAAGQHDPSFGRLHATLFRDDLVTSLCRRLWRETAQSDPLAALLVDHAVRTLILALLRVAGEPLPRSPNRGVLAPWQVRRVCGYIRDHLHLDISLSQLAGQVNLSPAHFCRAFRQSMGLPPHRWQLARRVDKARDLLTGTTLPVIEVAAQVGYSDPNQLARVFRKHLGVSPSRYRREQGR
jgi:AraC family transcriptional regulator